MNLSSAILAALLPAATLAGLVMLAVAFGGPRDPQPMQSINSPFMNVDYSGLPAASHFVARDGATLTFRAYLTANAAKGSVVLVHGSSATGISMHVMAKAFAEADTARTRWTSAGTASQVLEGTSTTSASWRTTSKTLPVPSRWHSRLPWPDSHPGADLFCDSRGAPGKSCSRIIFCCHPSSARTHRRIAGTPEAGSV